MLVNGFDAKLGMHVYIFLNLKANHIKITFLEL